MISIVEAGEVKDSVTPGEYAEPEPDHSRKAHGEGSVSTLREKGSHR